MVERPSAPSSSGSYDRVAYVAEGGMGYVELVVRRESRFERWYARKRLQPEFRKDHSFRAMFMDEARLAGLVRHPNVVSVLDVGEDADGPFLIMDFVEGQPLSNVASRAAEVGQEIPLQLCIRIAMEAARGLHAAHEVRNAEGEPLALVHRDVSPQNILVGYDGTVRVNDFGIAKAFGNSSRTTTGVLKGNLGYLSPEQLRFEEPDRRSDLFSLGVVLYELLAGERLYPNREGFDGPRRILNEPPPDVGHVRRGVPPELVELLFQLLAKDRQMRPATAEEVAVRLEAMLGPLIESEGTLSLAAFMQGHFGEQLRTQRQTLAREVLVLRERAQLAATEVRRRARRPWRAAGGVLTAAAVGVALWFLTRTPSVPPARGMPPTVWAGGWHTCAVEGSALYCWGKNNEGQLGIGSRADLPTRQRVVGLSHVASVSLGFFHTCACTRAGRAYCWGRNNEGQLGIGTTRGSYKPLPVPGLEDCRQIAAGPYHTCALRAGGHVACWGKNNEGQVGQIAREVLVPAEVPGVRDVVEIDASGDFGPGFSCARSSSGAVTCWGSNSFGQLGDGSRTSREVPAAVKGLTDVQQIALGFSFACARVKTGSVLCWGDNREGQLGVPGQEAQTVPGAPVAELADAAQIAVGRKHGCALRRTGRVLCWGNRIPGPGADGKTDIEPPSEVAELTDAFALTVGPTHNCVNHPTGILCWGWNETGQIGDGTKQVRLAPVSVAGFGP
jgi:eukaryotic-like serine/threonine-protein kinase